MGSIWKTSLRIVGQACFALISFIVLLFLASLFFLALGFGFGAGLGEGGFKDLSEAEKPSYRYIAGDKESDNRLLVLSVEGLILGSPPKDFGLSFQFPGITYGYAIQDMLKDAMEDESIKGILLHMQTPGGTIFGAKAIFDGMKAFQHATEKPVVAYIEGMSASGGVMAMVGADAIYADYGSLIGSIGVIGAALMYYDKPTATEGGLLGGGIVTQGGIEQTLIFAGRGKDLGNPFRRTSEEEVKTLQNGVNNEYENFVSHVAENRSIDETVIRQQMGAHVFDNESAQQYGLIDGTLNRDDSLRKLAELAQTGDDFQIVSPKNDRSHFLGQLITTLRGQSHSLERQQQTVNRDMCNALVGVPLVYYGDITRLCR
jgi:protease-4